MLKKIIKAHTAKLDFFYITEPTFLYKTLSFTNRERRVIASIKNFIHRKKSKPSCLFTI